MVPENRVFFCSTMAQPSRSASMVYSFTLWPPTYTAPLLTSYSRGIMLTSVVLALPVPPRMPTVMPLSICRSISDRFHASAVG